MRVSPLSQERGGSEETLIAKDRQARSTMKDRMDEKRVGAVWSQRSIGLYTILCARAQLSRLAVVQSFTFPPYLLYVPRCVAGGSGVTAGVTTGVMNGECTCSDLGVFPLSQQRSKDGKNQCDSPITWVLLCSRANQVLLVAIRILFPKNMNTKSIRSLANKTPQKTPAIMVT